MSDATIGRSTPPHDAPGDGAIELPAPGTRVRVTQQMPQAAQVWVEPVEGVITRYRQAKTGSWFAHSRGDRLWLDRLELRLDDGELTVLNLDRYSVIETLARPA